ncbi:MAG: diaminopimelate epimerase [Pseudomonadota bacterium]
MKQAFVKMQGAGNDFVLIDAREKPFRPDPDLVRWIADRRYGIGCDQLLVIEFAGGGTAYHIYNSDGSTAAQCGNGARCVARYLADLGAIKPGDTLQSPGGSVVVDFEAGLVSIDMGHPSFESAAAGFSGAARDVIEIDGTTWTFDIVSFGNPHAVIAVDDIGSAPVGAVGRALQEDERFAESVNVGFAQVVDRGHMRLIVYERGAGETLACGSGACAAVAVARRDDRVDDAVNVTLPGGTLRIFSDDIGSMRMAGPAEYSFRGEFER